MLTEAMARSLGVEFRISCPVIPVKHDSVTDCMELGLLNGGAQSYSHVINTTCLRISMNISNAGLNIAQHAALNQLTDGPATKIGVRFKTAWERLGGYERLSDNRRCFVHRSYGWSSIPLTYGTSATLGSVDG